jgi:hypothetical protein
MPSHDLTFGDGDAAMEIADKIDQFAKERLEQRWKLVIEDCFLSDLHNGMDSGPHHDPKLAEKTSDLVGLSRPQPNKPITSAVHCQDCLLVLSFLIDTNRIVGRRMASQIASPSTASFLSVLT